MNKFTISIEDKSKRLDNFLTEKLSNLTRSQVAKKIKEGLISVNGVETSVHRWLKVDDVVEILTEPLELSEKAAKKTRKKKEFSEDPLYGTGIWKKIKIIDDTPDYLVIEKPSGLLVHPTLKKEQNTLVDWLVSKYPDIRKIGEDPTRSAIVHRLDKEVSGLMVIPKTQDFFEGVKKQFKLRTIDKKYCALVYGVVKSDVGEISFPIKRSVGKSGVFAALPIGSEDGKSALTKYEVQGRYKNYSLLEVEIMTGRTHQIRVHLLALGHGIVGDPLYKNKGIKEKNKPERIFLHAIELAFNDLSGTRHSYKSELPNQLKDFLKKIK